MKKGFTLIEVIVVFAILGIVFAIAVPYCGKLGNSSQRADLPTPDKQAHAFLSSLYPGTAVTVSCVDMDSDGDGYVSCTARTPDGPMALECASLFSINSGCRLAMPRARIITQ